MIEIFSPAKVNLTLDVFPKQPGANFHELSTIYHKLDWGDRLKIEKSENFEILGSFDCTVKDNLIFKAWSLLDNPQAVKVTVDKKIPAGAGLGGGSSNAASFIGAYFTLFGLGPIPYALQTELGKLGKDIPFFLQPQPCALGTGFGDIIKPLDFDFSGTDIFLYFPPFSQNTAQAYQGLKTFENPNTPLLLGAQDLKLCGNTFNQLFEQKIYSKLIPQLCHEKINLCGSGSTFYSFETLKIPGCQKIKTTLL
jgi:4-diphosphocytidyl-2-C-methyl-D-erythritol kinase